MNNMTPDEMADILAMHSPGGRIKSFSSDQKKQLSAEQKGMPAAEPDNLKSEKPCKKIFKYEIPCKEKFDLELPRDATIIRCEDVEGKFFIWAIVNPDPENPKETRRFECYKTGQEIYTSIQSLRLIGTCKLFIMQELCLYVFEKLNP